MPIVNDGSLNIAALVVDDVYIVVVPPQTPIVSGVPTDGIGLVGTAMKGEPNKAILVGDTQSLVSAFGDLTTHTNDLVTEAVGAMKQGANNLWCVRVTDGSDTKAIKQILDSTGAGAVNLTAKSSGTWGNTISGSLGVGSNNTATYGVGTITVDPPVGTVGQTVQITINGIQVTYTLPANDNVNSVASNLAYLINTNSTLKKIVAATVVGNVATVTALTPGTIGNYTLTKGGTGAGNVVVAGFTGGGGTPTWKLSINSSYDLPEIFDNITTAGFADLIGALISAVNNGLVGVRGPSVIVTAAFGGGSSIIPIQTGFGTFATGTDGRTNIATSLMVGLDGFTRTGMYALRNLPISQFGLAGLSDTTAWALMLQFAKEENMVAVMSFPANTSTQTAAVNKVASGIDDYHAIIMKDWLWLSDTKNNMIRQVSPIGPMLGEISTLSPERSPSNKPINGYIGTERTGYVASNGTVVPALPYTYGELALLESNGINFITRPSVGGDYFACRHGQNASTSATVNGINYSKMTIFLTESFRQAMGFAVGEPHTAELRRRVKSAISQFLSSLQNPGAGRQPMIGDPNGGPAYSITCDATNNPDNLVAQGYLFVNVQVKYLAIVRFFVLSLEGGQSVTVKVLTNPLAA